MSSSQRLNCHIISFSVVSALVLAGCGMATSTSSEPFPVKNVWRPGLVAIDGHTGTGLGPDGYPNVEDPKPSPTQQFLNSLLLNSKDFSNGYQVELAEKGATLALPTLSFCGANFPSEAARLARRKVLVLNSAGSSTGMSVEAVQYESIDAARVALKQLRNSLTRCDSSSINLVATDTSDWSLAKSALVFQFQDLRPASVSTSIEVWQLRGNVLVCFTSVKGGSTPFNASELTDLSSLVKLLTQRLADAAAVDVGYF